MSQYIGTQDDYPQGYGDYHRDGLLDIFIGLMAMLFGLGMLVGMPWMAGVFPAAFLPAWQPARKAALRRIGVEEVPGDQKATARVVLVLLLMLGVLTLLFTLGLAAYLTFDKLPPSLWAWLHEFYMLILGGLAAVMLSLTGFLLGIGRLHAYAALALAVFISGHVLGISPPIYLTVFGGLVFLAGLVVLMRFLRQYPAP